jgi:hypothetical protein
MAWNPPIHLLERIYRVRFNEALTLAERIKTRRNIPAGELPRPDDDAIRLAA